MKEKLTVNVLFSGIGCQEQGIKDTGLFDLDVISTSDIDKEAILSYACLHCDLTEEMISNYMEYPPREQMAKELLEMNIGYDVQKDKPYDWMKLTRKKANDIEKYWLACKLSNQKGDISKIESLPYADLWTISFCCFTKDTLVLSNRGYVPISDLALEDKVLTKKNSYCSVEKVKNMGQKEIYEINAMCFDNLRTTDNHRFLTRKRKRVWDNSRRNYDRVFSEPIWTECKDLNKDTYLGYAINQNSIIPKWNGVIDKRGNVINNLSKLFTNKSFWWIVGRYIADGWCRTQGGITIRCGKSKVGQIEPHLDNCQLHYCKTEDRTVKRYDIPLIELETFVKQFGYKADGKFIPNFVFDLPIELLKSFFNGYMAGDGCVIKGYYKATSVSKILIYGLGQIVAKIYNRPFAIYYCRRNPTTITEERIVNQKDTYTIVFKKEKGKQDKAFYEDGYIWFPINSVENTHEIEEVYDITVNESHSFTANGVIVHNCQDISVAGKMKGFKPDSGTRSSLLWENIRLLKDAVDRGESPKYLMFENVKNLVGKNFIDDFNKLLDVINDLGFNSYWKVINAKDCGVPQNRERVFVICIHKDIDKGKFEFPKPFNTGIRLKDISEKDVDEKYYLSENIQKRFKITDETMTKSIIGTTIGEECTRFGQRDVVYQENCIIGTLTATDYKQPKQILEITSEPFIVASRGRYSNENESNETYQNFEPRTDGLTNTITTVQKDNYIVNTNRCVQVGDLQHYGYDKMNRVYSKEGLCPTLRTMTEGDRQPRFLENVEPRIRKLTPYECWKLMGWTKEYFNKAKNIGISDSSLYKQAGNGIVTNCVELIFEHFYKAQYNENFECTDENFTQPQVD